MKKLFMFLAVAGLATFGAACSSDDGGGDGKPTLVAKATPAAVQVNQNVTFSATADSKAVEGVKFYSEGKELGNPHKFTAKGDYKVIAKKDGFLDSASITVKVTEAGGGNGDGDGDGDGNTEKKQLVLTLTPSEIQIGETVTFYVMEGSTNVTSSSDIYVNGTKITGTSYVGVEAGEFTAVAKKEGALDSDGKKFTVLEAPEVPENNFLQVGNDVIALAGASFHYFKQGEFVYSEELEDGRVIVPFMYRMFTRDITGNIEVADFDNHSTLLFFVVQNEGETSVKWPWQAAPEDIMLSSFDGEIGGVEWESDAETGFALPVSTAPDAEGRGTLTLAVEGNTTTGAILGSMYENAFQAYFVQQIPEGRGVKFSAKMGKSLRDGVRTNSINNLKRK